MKKTIQLGDLTITVDVETTSNAPKRDSFGRFAPNTKSTTITRSTKTNFAPIGEPDGFDAHIDRPRRENYRGDWYLSEQAFKEDLAKYRKAESAVKACNWPCREPMGNGIPKWPVPQPMPQHSGTLIDEDDVFVPKPQPQPSVVTSKAWTQPKPKKNVQWVDGIVPIGAVVVDHTWNGEPIFNK